MRKTYNLLPLLMIIIIFVAVRIYFITYTDHTAEDAHITFQFARNIARGDGFSLNAGEPIYGSTTPLLTLLLAGWLLFSDNIIVASSVIAILSGCTGLWFLWNGIGNKLLAVCVAIPIIFSSKLLKEEMQGMEMSLVFLFSMMSWYFFTKRNPAGVGIASGLLLWTRVDTVVFVACLLLFMAISDWRMAFRVALWTTAIYFPWLLFAWMYFGSPIPFTITAKQVAYGIGNPPYIIHAGRIYDYITQPWLFLSFAGMYLAWWDRKYIPFALFILLDSARMILTGATFFSRYFHMIFVSTLLLSGFALYTVLNRWKPILVASLALVIATSISGIRAEIDTLSGLQNHRHKTLTAMGVWLNENTPQDATVLLEPLGYVGWYADRIMYDEVGLVTPLAVDLHRQRIRGALFYLYFKPDYVIWHCNDGGDTRQSIALEYRIIKTFDGNFPRSCYDIWKRMTP